VVPSLAGLAPFQIAFVVSDLERATRYADWLAERGEGFQQVGYLVGSLERTTAEMEAAGHPAIARMHSFGEAGDGAAACYDTAEALDFLVEAVDAPTSMPPADFTR
jgi:hypothetical protein